MKDLHPDYQAFDFSLGSGIERAIDLERPDVRAEGVHREVAHEELRGNLDLLRCLISTIHVLP
jgi:hypothetical protein